MRLSSRCLPQAHSALLPPHGSLSPRNADLHLPGFPGSFQVTLQRQVNRDFLKAPSLALEYSSTQHLLLQHTHHNCRSQVDSGTISPPSRADPAPTQGLRDFQCEYLPVRGTGRNEWIYLLPFPGMWALSQPTPGLLSITKAPPESVLSHSQTPVCVPHPLFLGVEHSIRNIPPFTPGKRPRWMQTCEAWKGPTSDSDFSYPETEGLSKAPNWGSESLHDLPQATEQRVWTRKQDSSSVMYIFSSRSFPQSQRLCRKYMHFLSKPELICLSNYQSFYDVYIVWKLFFFIVVKYTKHNLYYCNHFKV